MPAAGALVTVRQKRGVENKKEREGMERLGQARGSRDLGRTLAEAEGRHGQWAEILQRPGADILIQLQSLPLTSSLRSRQENNKSPAVSAVSCRPVGCKHSRYMSPQFVCHVNRPWLDPPCPGLADQE